MDVSDNRVVHYNRVFHYNPSILNFGVTLFLETPICPLFWSVWKTITLKMAENDANYQFSPTR